MKLDVENHGFHLFGEWAGPWVAAHFDLEQWAQSWGGKREIESQRKETIPELVGTATVAMRGENPNTGMKIVVGRTRSEEAHV